VSKLASKFVKVVLTGDGGDEVLSGYTSYQSEKYSKLFNKFPKEFFILFSKLLDMMIYLSPSNRKNLLSRFKKISLRFYNSFNTSALEITAFFDYSKIKSLCEPLNCIHSDDYLNIIFSDCSFDDPFYRNMFLHSNITLPEQMLQKVESR
jgi:asparagine synthase (glutamine-hydrolysing)